MLDINMQRALSEKKKLNNGIIYHPLKAKDAWRQLKGTMLRHFTVGNFELLDTPSGIMLRYYIVRRKVLNIESKMMADCNACLISRFGHRSGVHLIEKQVPFGEILPFKVRMFPFAVTINEKLRNSNKEISTDE